ncbi:MAG: preprotein translocase subunit SecE [Lachnospiraceae bacterium]|nr:preprotein translocase subunit SecE [Lachnospiraceae bacterium]
MSETMEKTPKKKGFFAGVKSEFKRITWPAKATVARQTLAVVLVTIVLGAVIVIVDNIIQSGLNFIL